MAPLASPQPAAPRRDASDRVVLARLALAAATGTPGVLAGDAGVPPLTVTADPPSLLRGVAVAASPDGGYDVSLRLVTELVPLHALAERVRKAVRGAAVTAGLADRLADIAVEIVDVRAAGEPSRAGAASAWAPPSPAVVPPGALPAPSASAPPGGAP